MKCFPIKRRSSFEDSERHCTASRCTVLLSLSVASVLPDVHFGPEQERKKQMNLEERCILSPLRQQGNEHCRRYRRDFDTHRWTLY